MIVQMKWLLQIAKQERIKRGAASACTFYLHPCPVMDYCYRCVLRLEHCNQSGRVGSFQLTGTFASFFFAFDCCNSILKPKKEKEKGIV